MGESKKITMRSDQQGDIHVLKYFSSFISVSGGRVINITDPALSYCPLASHLYKGFRDIDKADKEAVKREIVRAIESKIRDHGLFTHKRKLLAGDVAIPYGASEILMFALDKKMIDAAVVVCDGAGTVITDNAQLVQGIGARMNSLVLTSPIKGVIDRLEKLGCGMVLENAIISQVVGVEKAIKSGYKRIAVTVSGHDADKLKDIRDLEKAGGVRVTVLVVCTTGATRQQVDQIGRYADIVWSCASDDIRRRMGASALLQISKQIPVFVMTQNGIDLVAACADNVAIFSSLDPKDQYLISHEPEGQKFKFGAGHCFLRAEKLPVLSAKSFSMAKD